MGDAEAGQFAVPYGDRVADQGGLLSRIWQKLFREISESLISLGTEKTFQLANNSGLKAIEGLSFTSTSVSQAVIEYLVQRITTGAGATEIITSGTLHAVYKPIAQNWALVPMGSPGPSTSGITFSISNLGQVLYTSTNITGTPSISRIVWKARTLSAKSALYSTAGK